MLIYCAETENIETCELIAGAICRVCGGPRCPARKNRSKVNLNPLISLVVPALVIEYNY